jgi:DNA-binding transcriptional LysR family regulator
MSEPLDSRQLKAFVTLARTGSYTDTAKELFVTHSAISHAMRALETNAGCRLLSKLGKKIILTDAGEALLQHAEHVLEEMRQARLTLNGLSKWGFRRLRVAAEASLGQAFLTAALVKFHREFPRLLMSVDLFGSCDTHTLLQTNRVDLVLAEKPLPDDRFEFIPLFADRFHIVVNPAHPWAVLGSAPGGELPKHPCILYRSSPETRRRLEEYLAKDEIVLNTVVEIDNVEAAKEFVKQTTAMSILPFWAIRREVNEGSLVALPLGRKAFDHTWGCIHWRARSLNHAESTFLKICRAGVAAFA